MIRADRIAKAALFSDVLKKARGNPTTEREVQQCERVALRGVAIRCAHAEDEMGLFGLAVHDIAGYAVLGLTFGGLLGLVWLFNLRLAPGTAQPE